LLLVLNILSLGLQDDDDAILERLLGRKRAADTDLEVRPPFHMHAHDPVMPSALNKTSPAKRFMQGNPFSMHTSFQEHVIAV
jgi:hypothetical protein